MVDTRDKYQQNYREEKAKHITSFTPATLKKNLTRIID